MSSIGDINKDFTKIIDNLSYSKSKATIFSDWLEIAAIFLRQTPFNAGELPKDESYQEFEDRYLEIAGRYSREELDQLGQLLALTIKGIHSKNCDFLGDIYSSNELINKRAAQFFTPFPISAAMAKATMGDIAKQVEDKGIITVCDPSSGAGGTLIASACEVADQLIDPRSHVQFYATDISRDCFNMTFIQLSVMDLQAVVHHGNTLSQEIWETRKTPQMLLFENWLRTVKANQKTTQMVEQMRQFLSQLEEPKAEPLLINSVKPPSEAEADYIFPPKQLSLFD